MPPSLGFTIEMCLYQVSNTYIRSAIDAYIRSGNVLPAIKRTHRGALDTGDRRVEQISHASQFISPCAAVVRHWCPQERYQALSNKPVSPAQCYHLGTAIASLVVKTGKLPDIAQDFPGLPTGLGLISFFIELICTISRTARALKRSLSTSIPVAWGHFSARLLWRRQHALGC